MYISTNKISCQIGEINFFDYIFGCLFHLNQYKYVRLFPTTLSPGRQTGVSQQAQKDTNNYNRKDGEEIEREAACHLPVSQEEAIFGCRRAKTGGRGDEKEQRDQQ